MGALLGLLVGLVVGGLGGVLVAGRRQTHLRDDVVSARAEMTEWRVKAEAAGELLEQEKVRNSEAVAALTNTFKSISNEVLRDTVDQYAKSQQQFDALRDEKMSSTLTPLTNLLEQYRQQINEFSEKHAGALSTVQERTAAMLNAHTDLQRETSRLNQLLGRSDQRGHWGEVQLANVMNASGLRPNIDYELQHSATDDSGRARRPDCIVKMPNRGAIAVDAKFPFDAFEEGVAQEDPEARRQLFAKHAADLRNHVKTLKTKSYWEVLDFSPEFTVCFVPSDYVLATALEADNELLSWAADQRVVLAGPTNLLSLLWSVAMVLRQHDVWQNATHIQKLGSEIYDRIRIVAEKVGMVGKNLNGSVKAYNEMVASMESRLFKTARDFRDLGVPGKSEIPEASSVDRLAAGLNYEAMDPALPSGTDQFDLGEEEM